MDSKKTKVIIFKVIVVITMLVPTSAKASGFPVIDIAHILSTNFNIAENAGTFIETAALFAWENFGEPLILAEIKERIIGLVGNEMVTNFTTGNDGQPLFVTNWQDYLYKAPQDKARASVKNDYIYGSGINSLSGGKCGANVNPYYDYLCVEAEDSIKTSRVVTDLPDYYDSGVNPQDDLFASGDLRGFNAYFQCGNNPYCTAAKTKELNAQVAAQNKEVAENQVGEGGVLSSLNPDGSVKTPNSIISNSINDTLLMGNGVLVNATTWPEVAVGIFATMLNSQLETGFHDSGAVDTQIDFTQYGL